MAIEKPMKQPDNRLERVRPLFFIIGALALWGIYLAAGATNLFTPNAAAFDLRKFFIVGACSAGYLAFWWGNMRLANRRQKKPNTGPSTSISGVLALVLSIVAYALWAWAHQVSDELAMRIGLVVAALFGCSVVAAMIGISDRAPKSAKWTGTVAFVLFLLAIVLFVVQIQMYVAR